LTSAQRKKRACHRCPSRGGGRVPENAPGAIAIATPMVPSLKLDELYEMYEMKHG